MFKADIDSNTYIAILEPRHAEQLFQCINENRESIGNWLEFPQHTHEVQDTLNFINKSLHSFASNNGYWTGIWHKDKLAGSIGYLYIDYDNNKTEIGYWLGKDFEGMGLISKACHLLINHAFSDLKLNKVEINVATHNSKSRAIPKRLGFTEEGIVRDYEFLNGVYLDRTLYGLLKEEWLRK